MENYDKKRYTMLKVIAGACIGMFLVILISAVIIVPQVSDTFIQLKSVGKNLDPEKLDTLVTEVGEFIADAETSLSDATQKIDQVDFKNLNDAIKNFSDAVEKMDIEELNRAVKNLSDLIEPIAKFFNR